MELNKGLNLDCIPEASTTGDYRYAQNIELNPSQQFPVNERGLIDIGITGLDNICGIIPYDKGLIVFGYTVVNTSNWIKVINTKDLPESVIKTIDCSNKLNFSKDYPVRGTVTYNEDGSLICCFSCGVKGFWEDKVININIISNNLTDKELYLMDVNPTLTFPKITHGTDEVNNELILGTLLTGAYQIAVSYKVDKEYSNYSLLSLPVYVYGTNGSPFKGTGDITMGLEPGSVSKYGINYKLNNLDTYYDYYRIAIIYSDGKINNVFVTSDISTTNSVFKLTDINNYEKSTLDETLINSIFYSNSETLNIMNNRVYRANLRSLDKAPINALAQTLADNCSLALTKTLIPVTTISKKDSNVLKDKQYIKFQSGEVAALYLTIGDKKGNIIGSYPIRTQSVSGGLVIAGEPEYTANDAYSLTTRALDSIRPTTFRGNLTIPHAALRAITVKIINRASHTIETFVIPAGAMSVPCALSDSDIVEITPYNDGTEQYADNKIDPPVLYSNAANYTWGARLIDIADIYIFVLTQYEVINLDYDPDPLSPGYQPILVDPTKIDLEVHITNDMSTVPIYVHYLMKYTDSTSNAGYILLPATSDTTTLNITGLTKTILSVTIIKFTYTVGVGEVSIFTTGNYITDYSDGKLYENVLDPDIKAYRPQVATDFIGDHKVYVLRENGQYATYYTTNGRVLVSSPKVHPAKTITGDPVTPDYKPPYYNIPKEVGTTTTFEHTSNYITVSLPTDMSPYSLITDNVGFWCIHRAERNNTNSRIYTQAIAVAGATQKYVNSKLFYPSPINSPDIPSDLTGTEALADVYFPYGNNVARFTDNYGRFRVHALQDFWAECFTKTITPGLIDGTTPQLYSNASGGWVDLVRDGDINIVENVRAYKYLDGTILRHFALWYRFDEHWYGDTKWCEVREFLKDPHTGLYFKSGVTLNKSVYPIRLYSFEDLYTKNEYFPSISAVDKENLEIISLVDTVVSADGVDDNFNSYTEEHIITNNRFARIVAQRLIADNNIKANNFYQESCRELYLDRDNTALLVGDIANKTTPDIAAASSFFKVNAFNANTKFYENLYTEVLVLCSNLNNISQKSIIANGDTFYSEMNIRSRGYYYYNNGVVPFPYAKVPSLSISQIASADSAPLGGNWHDVSYNYTFLIESKFNVNARYWKGDYPKYDNPINTSTQSGYDKVYHLENKQNVTKVINPNIPLDADNLFPSRIIMSTKTNAEKNGIGFKKYLALDYYDMPYNRGAIRALHSNYKNLFVQQDLALSIASIKDIISYNDMGTFVGSGELFDRQPNEVIPTGYGFVGCESFFNTGMSDMGYWVIDIIKSNIFLVTDKDVQILSDGKCREWFRDKLKGKNPYNDGGCAYITYETKYRRFLLTVTNPDSTKAFTLSYIPEIKNWLSFHSYIPTYGIYSRISSYLLINSKLYKYTDSLKGIYGDGIKESIISFYINDHPNVNLLFESLYWSTKYVIDNVDIYDQTFTTLRVHNESQCTEAIDLNTNAKWNTGDKEWFDTEHGTVKSNVWMFNQLFDYVIDNRKPFLKDFITYIQNSSNELGVNNNFNLNKEWFEKSKIMSTFAAVTFYFDNMYYSSNGKLKADNKTTTTPINTTTYKQPSILLKELSVLSNKDKR